MGTESEYRLMERYCVGRGINLCCQHTQIGDSIGVDADRNARAAQVTADVRSLPFRTGSWDYALCHHGLEHIRDAPLFVVHEWLRVVKTGGKLVIIVPAGENGESALNYASFSGQAMQYGHGHLFTKDTLKEIVKFAGGDIEVCRYLDSPERTGKSILIVATKSKRHDPCMVEFSVPIEIGRMVQKNGVWKCLKRLTRRLLVLSFLTLFGLPGCCGNVSPTPSVGTISALPTSTEYERFPTPQNEYEEYIDRHREELIHEFGRIPKTDEIPDWERRLK